MQAGKFHQGESSRAKQAAFNDGEWQTVDVPHDWSIAGPFDEHADTKGSGGWLPSGIAWYRKTISVPTEAEGKAYQGRCIVVLRATDEGWITLTAKTAGVDAGTAVIIAREET